jgi:hypothetical protein
MHDKKVGCIKLDRSVVHCNGENIPESHSIATFSH